MKYVKKPVTVEAVGWTGSNGSEICQFVGEAAFFKEGELYIETLEGTHHASVGDYIIKGVHGEFYPCKPDIFAQTYEAFAEDKRAAEKLPWKQLHVGERVWFLWWDDDANAWEIGQEVATAVGYEGFWYSGDLKNPLSADAFVPWDRIGIDAFLTQQAARERMEAANE